MNHFRKSVTWCGILCITCTLWANVSAQECLDYGNSVTSQQISDFGSTDQLYLIDETLFAVTQEDYSGTVRFASVTMDNNVILKDKVDVNFAIDGSDASGTMVAIHGWHDVVVYGFSGDDHFLVFRHVQNPESVREVTLAGNLLGVRIDSGGDNTPFDIYDLDAQGTPVPTRLLLPPFSSGMRIDGDRLYFGIASGGHPTSLAVWDITDLQEPVELGRTEIHDFNDEYLYGQGMVRRIEPFGSSLAVVINWFGYDQDPYYPAWGNAFAMIEVDTEGMPVLQWEQGVIGCRVPCAAVAAQI